MTDVRKGQAPAFPMQREEFRARFMRVVLRPGVRGRSARRSSASRRSRGTPTRKDRKAPRTHKAGPGFQDPGLRPLGRMARDGRARRRPRRPARRIPRRRSRVLLVCGSPRNDGSCPGEMSKTYRLVQIAARGAEGGRASETDVLDLSRVTSDFRLHIHPCKGCVSTAQPLCHWPCSCYPNHAFGQVNDWMAEIYERWAAAHGVILFTPVHWYQATSALKLMIDRLVCADGGNPDPTTTQGKDAEKAKALELAGWGYPKHLAGRAYGVVVHGDVSGVEAVRRALCDWLDWMGLIDAGPPRAPRPPHRLLRALRHQPRGARPRHRRAGGGAQRGARTGRGGARAARGQALRARCGARAAAREVKRAR